MRIEFPQSIDPYPIQDDLATRDGHQDPNSLTQLDLIYSILEIEKRVGALDAIGMYRTDNQPADVDTWIADSHEYRLTEIENEGIPEKLAALTLRVASLEARMAVVEAGGAGGSSFAIVDTGVSSAGEDYALPSTFTLATGYAVIGIAIVAGEDVGFLATKGNATVNIKPYKTGAAIDIVLVRVI